MRPPDPSWPGMIWVILNVQVLYEEIVFFSGCPKTVVPPNHPVLVGLSIIDHPCWGTHIWGNIMKHPYMIWYSTCSVCLPKKPVGHVSPVFTRVLPELDVTWWWNWAAVWSHLHKITAKKSFNTPPSLVFVWRLWVHNFWEGGGTCGSNLITCREFQEIRGENFLNVHNIGQRSVLWSVWIWSGQRAVFDNLFSLMKSPTDTLVYYGLNF